MTLSTLPSNMTRQEAAKLTRELLDANNLSDWHIRLATDLTRPWLGKCSYQDKTIFLNAFHIDTHPAEEVDNTIRHEVAHALCPMHQHDDVWASKAKELGCSNTMSCATYSLDARAIDALRSGQTLEVTFDEQVIRTPKYKVTRLQDTCPTCNKVAVEIHSFEANGKKIIYLKCGHVISKVAESYSPFESIVSNDWKPEIKNCKHEWNIKDDKPIDTSKPKNQCLQCGEFRLYPFQVEGARYLEKSNGRAGIFDEMGLGKTVQDLAWLKFHPEAFPCLFVVKSGIKYQWMKEIIRWLGINYLVQVIQTSNDALLPGLKCYIISYDMLVPKSRTYKNGKTVNSGFDIEKFKKIGIKSIKLDECQQIKNPDSTRTQMVRRIAKDVPHIIPLSGTPWKNRGSEFFPVLNMLDPIKFHSYQGFLDRWVEFYYDGAHKKMGGIARPNQFKEYVKDIVIRRERSEVMKDLPVIQRNAFYCEMEETTQKAYNNEVQDFVKFWNQAVIGGEEDSFESSQHVLARITRMRHITGLAKIPQTVEFVKEFLEDTERKIVIFVHHKDVGQIVYDQLANHCMQEHIAQPLKLTADLSSEERYNVQERFNSPNYRVMVGSTLASGEGLNLQTCADCIMHERQWNPANEMQAEGRFIRIGQQSNAVIATYMLAQNSIDDLFHQIVERKRAMFNAVMSDGKVETWHEAGLVKELAQSIVDSARR